MGMLSGVNFVSELVVDSSMGMLLPSGDWLQELVSSKLLTIVSGGLMVSSVSRLVVLLSVSRQVVLSSFGTLVVLSSLGKLVVLSSVGRLLALLWL